MKSSLALSLAALSLVTFACDDRPDLPRDSSDSRPAQTTGGGGPTTRELLTGERKMMSLGYIPFRLKVPPGWSIEMNGIGGMVFLKGPTPTGAEVQIQLAQRLGQSKSQLEYLIEGAKKDAARNAESTKKLDLRHMGDVTILERQSIGQALPSSDVRLADNSPEYRWTISLFVPKGTGFAQYEMNFFDLTVNRFEADHAFLESILKTLQLDTAPKAP